MAEPKPLASLSPALLARKGGARPAMRPQFAPLQVEAGNQPGDELGWNDMGHDHAPELAPAPTLAPVPVVPEVVRQRDEASRRLSAAQRRSALAEGRRAAFTLRVDAERHLRLRLACTVQNRSAQQLVTDALDRLLAELPEISELAETLGQRARS